MVPADRGEVDRRARQLLVAGVELREVAVADDGVAHPPGGEVHHRVADVAELEIEHGDDPAVGVVKLARVPHDRRFPSLGVDRVAPEPSDRELEERIGVLLERAVVLLVAVESGQPGAGRIVGAMDAGLDERLDGERMESGQDREIVVDHRVALVVGSVGEVLLAGDPVHHVGLGLVDPAPHGGDGNAVVAEQRLEGHLVLEREDQGHVGAVAAHHQLVARPFPVDRGEPHGAPAGLASEVDDPRRRTRSRTSD